MRNIVKVDRVDRVFVVLGEGAITHTRSDGDAVDRVCVIAFSCLPPLTLSTLSTRVFYGVLMRKTTWTTFGQGVDRVATLST